MTDIAWSFLEDSTSVVVLRVDQAGTVVAANQHAKRLIGGPLIGQAWDSLLLRFGGALTLADWLASTVRPRLLNIPTSAGLPQSLEVRVELIGTDYLLFGEINHAQQALLHREVMELNQELNTLGRELALNNAELKLYRDHLEELVDARTLELARANAAAELAHRENVERQRIEAEARMQSSKLEAIGTLAAGIAHDFNNVLGSIVGFAEMTADDLPVESRARGNIDQILSASFHARDLLARMLAFTRQGLIAPLLVDAGAQTRETLALLRASLPHSVHLSFWSGMEAAGIVPVLLAESTQIQQIVMNLCINAAHAMDDKGTIRIRLDPAAGIDAAPPLLRTGLCLSVSDDGCGISAEVRERIFDPFFTTKAPGKGSGLGLSVVYGIVTGLGGVIDVRSEIAGDSTGTEFRVFLPLAKAHH